MLYSKKWTPCLLTPGCFMNVQRETVTLADRTHDPAHLLTLLLWPGCLITLQNVKVAVYNVYLTKFLGIDFQKKKGVGAY